ncbi:acyl-CoA carboxylase epsilon subunit [Microlunatus sp. Gsoil 973]|uniref:acyl-CoA carboxylase epsilon subunit n=1 Tax=Microlunatus sp. Gsoil 973 TaxID=2672569 RepID=UPI0012B48A11|nr:acyl-CoA carboxylase epsilon subunit [Microlunatus sp. Gsoil 973]QGN35217.1 acyl-CoA carboxylase subunit epsilon [Microlunatus sp. Gsoil 973]
MNVAENSADPTDEEVAAVLALLAVRAAGRTTEPDRPPSGWAAYWRTVKAPIQPGPGKWQAAVRGW